MLRPPQAAPPTWWAWACIVIFVSGAWTQVPWAVAWLTPLGFGLGTLYPALVLAGALALAGRAVPVWLLPLAFAIGVGRGGAALTGQAALAHAVAIAVEPAMSLLAATLVWRARGPRDGAAERALAPAFVALAALEVVTAVSLWREGPMSPPLIGVWLAAVPLLLAVQLAAWGARSRRDLQRVRELLEQQVAEQTERYRTVSELSSDYSFAYRVAPNREVQEEWVTDALTRISGYMPEELEGLGWLKTVHPDDREEVFRQLDAVTRRECDTMEYRILTKAGDERWLNVRFSAVRDVADGSVRVVGAARDITQSVRAQRERHRLDLRMRETQRMEALGRLAGGIAHDFNNALTVILGNSQLALEEQPGAPDAARLRRISAAARYAAGLTDQILAYSGKAAVALEALDLSQLVAEMMELLRASVAENARIEVDLPNGLPAVEGDVTQMRQVLVNLVTNASDAMGEEGGEIRIRTGTRELGEREIEAGVGFSDATPGRYVFLEVVDSAGGLDAEAIPRIFEPFYTTKASGRGLGLAAVQGIVRAHRGVILGESAPGRGTSFQVFLPRGARAAAPAEPAGAEEPPAVGGRVLVVDDDDAVLEVAREVLRRVGFEVETAVGGRAAVELLESGARFDAVLLDLAMPELSGEATFLALRELQPGLTVVLASGYDREHAAERFSARGVADFVRKPYEPDDLVRRLREAIGRRAD